MTTNEVLDAYQLSQHAIADLKYAVLIVLYDGPEAGLRNVDVGKALGIYAGHAGHEGHIPRVLLSQLEHEGLVYQDRETKLWKLKNSPDTKSRTVVRELRPRLQSSDFRPLRVLSADEAIRKFYESYKLTNGQRPLASDLLAAGYNLKSLPKTIKTWFDFVNSMGDLNSDEAELLESNRDFFELIEKTAMTKSFKMLTLLAMLDADAMPGSVSLDDLAAGIEIHAVGNLILEADFGKERLASHSQLKRLLKENPIKAWIGGNTAKPSPYFKFDDDQFSANFEIDDSLMGYFENMAQELVDWRIAEYLQRPGHSQESYTCRIIQSGGRPIIRIPDREQFPEFPEGETELLVDGKKYTAKFVKYFLNVIRDSSGNNVLGELVRGFYGDDAGQPGTKFDVIFTNDENGWSMRKIPT